MFNMQVLASQFHFQANRNAELAIPPLSWPVSCIKIRGHVALPSGPTVYSLYCDSNIETNNAAINNKYILMHNFTIATCLKFWHVFILPPRAADTIFHAGGLERSFLLPILISE